MKARGQLKQQNTIPFLRNLFFIWKSSFNLLFPNRCVFCKSLVNAGSCVCPDCLCGIPIVGEIVCCRCGAPLGEVLQASGLPDPINSCYHCRELVFDFTKNESLGVFEGKMRELIHMFKFRGRKTLFRVFAELLLTHKATYIGSHDALTPVPLSLVRLRERGFNQSYLVGRAVAAASSIPFFGTILTRRGKSKPQSSIASLNERMSNLTDRFILGRWGQRLVAGKRILLIDDVLTTGATASACARALYQSGAGQVNLLTIARALRGPQGVFHDLEERMVEF